MAKDINQYDDFGIREFFGEEGIRDLQRAEVKSAIETAVEEVGIRVARKIARNLTKCTLTNEEIAEVTGLSLAEIARLRHETK